MPFMFPGDFIYVREPGQLWGPAALSGGYYGLSAMRYNGGFHDYLGGPVSGLLNRNSILPHVKTNMANKTNITNEFFIFSRKFAPIMSRYLLASEGIEPIAPITSRL